MWSTDPFRTWTGIVGVAGALERKVWLRSQGANIYPNLYVFLVGPPGVGKTRPVQECHDLWEALEEHHVAPVSLTKAALVDRLKASDRTVSFPKEEHFNSLLVAAKELGALIPNYDADFLNALTYFYDNLKYDEERRGAKEELVIEKPTVNLIGCTTPSYLLNTMPIGAWDQGFLSRVIIIYDSLTATTKRELDLSEETHVDESLRKALMHDIKLIGRKAGKLTFAPEAGELLQKWYADEKGIPSHPRLQNYVTRRPIHMLKLCMIACADRTDSPIISLEDVQAAIDWITAAEAKMGDVFTAMASGGDANVMAECWHWVITMQAREGQPVSSHRLWEYIGSRVPSYAVQNIVNVMCRSGFIRGETIEGITVYYAKTK